MRVPCLRLLLLAAALAATTGCATVFRSPKVTVHVESDPAGAEARVHKSPSKPTPNDFEVQRKATTAVTITKPGYADHRGLVKKKLNGGWVAADIISCFWALCIPLLVDAISGRWLDVAPRYDAKLEPTGDATSTIATGEAVTPAAPSPPTVDVSSLSESERKATARAAYSEGVELQQNNDCASALPKFEVAEKMFSAPTHLIRIAQCQAATGKLVEAHESYEKLTRMPLGKDAPDVFRQAQEQGKKELPALKPRIPTLRVQVTPPPSSLKNLVVLLNGSPMMPELIGIARPVNPGKYKISAEASGTKAAPVEIEVAEGASKSVDLRIGK
jgi:hypothetical protein